MRESSKGKRQRHAGGPRVSRRGWSVTTLLVAAVVFLLVALPFLQAGCGSNGDGGGSDGEDVSGATVIDFYADWCGPCKQMDPVLEELEEEFSGEVEVRKVNVDEEPGLADEYKIQYIPTYVFLDSGGREVDRIVGGCSESELRAKFQSLAGGG